MRFCARESGGKPARWWWKAVEVAVGELTTAARFYFCRIPRTVRRNQQIEIAESKLTRPHFIHNKQLSLIMSDATEPKVEKTEAPAAAEEKPTSSSVFSMFGGGAKKEKKDEEERGDVSGSAKSQREAASAAKAEGGDDVC